MVTYFRKYFHTKLLQQNMHAEMRRNQVKEKQDKFWIIMQKNYIKWNEKTLFLGEWNVFILVAKIKSKIKIIELQFL